jgi:hypothetical protein
MNYIKQDKLEDYVERHRADFDLHEPQPGLWAALEKQLHGEATQVGEPVMTIVEDSANKEEPGRQIVFTTPLEQPKSSARWAWAERYSLAAALAVLVLAAGLGEAWKSGRAVSTGVASTSTVRAAATTNADAALYLAPTGVLELTNASQNMDARLDTAVHGMESYYVNQLSERKAELSQLAPDATADWAIQLVELDSSYQRLKRELPQHPQPEVVLAAMNRNLQIRLDILDQQLQLHAPAQTAISREARAEYALADSRELSRNTLRHDR